MKVGFFVFAMILLLSDAFCYVNYYVDDSNGNDAWDGLAQIWDGMHGPKKTIKAAARACAR